MYKRQVHATTGITVNQDATIAVYFDMDRDYTTGEDNPFCKASKGEPELGPEYRINYYYDSRASLWLANGEEFTGGPTPWVVEAWALGEHAYQTAEAGWEGAVAYSAMGLTQTQCISVGVHFEQFDSDQDDSVCDITWCYTDGVTAVDLSSFTASSESSGSPVVDPSMLALLGLGLAFLAAGGLVLSQGMRLAR